jgi:F420-non-reducing hydrogenase small subunit
MSDTSSDKSPGKPKVAFYWCASCGGCEEAVVDLAEAILDVVAAVDIVFWPVAMDFKRKDVESMADGSITATFLNGAIRTSEQESMARLLRSKSQLLVALGACSHLGGIPGLANLFDRDGIMQAVYVQPPSTINVEAVFPQTHFQENGHSVDLPALHDTVRSLDQVVDVDYYIPGCPPTPKTLIAAVHVLLGSERPVKGTVLAPDCALCDECPRKATKPDKLAFTEFKRPQQMLIDEEKCLLAQGLLCMGPGTRSGCEALCVRGNMPCTGCYGPTSRVRDQGAKILSCLASFVDSKDETEIERILTSIPDPVGTLYRYALPGSLLRRKNLGVRQTPVPSR